MKNLLDYLVKNTKSLNYVVSNEPFYKDRKLVNNELKISDINQFTNYLYQKKIKNERIGILLENCNGFVKAFYSILLIGKTVVSINNKVELDELEEIVRKNKLELIITNEKNCHKLKKINIDYINIDEKITENVTLNFEPVAKTKEDILVISYTSGTSGSFSKGVCLTYDNITFVSTEYKKVYKLNTKSKIITVLPLWHNYAMFACLTSSIVAKASLIIMNEWNASLFLDINKFLNPDVFPGSPYMYIDLINNHNEELISLTNLKVCDSGGDSLPISCINKFESMTGAVITEGYGLTETASLTHFNYSASERKVGSLGKAVSRTKCKILDLDGKEVKNGTYGLLWIKGPMVFSDYVELPGLVDEVKNKGWFNTNDVVKCDDEGYYYIAGRFSDLKALNDGDSQLRNLENSIYGFNGLSRVFIKSNYNSLANFYYFDIFAILKDNYKIEDLYDYINANLREYVIGTVKVVDTLPTTGTGKIKRNKVNELIEIRPDDYKKIEINGGMRSKTYLLEGDNKYIYQEYFENTKYQAKKKYDISNIVLSNDETTSIPKAISYGENKEKSWLITEYKKGKTLNELRKEKMDISDIAADLTKTLYKIHNSSNYNKYGWITDTTVFDNETFIDYLNSEIQRFVDIVKEHVDSETLDIILAKANQALEIVKKYSDNYKPQLLWFDLNPSNILIDRINGKYKLSAIIDPGGAKYGIKEWDIAFLRCETCINEKEYKSVVDSYKKLDKTLNEEVIEALCVFIELDDMIIRVVDQIDLPIPYCTVFKDIISKIE
ncbi:MAG: AMP-binding protein [Bacilli bacterium]